MVHESISYKGFGVLGDEQNLILYHVQLDEWWIWLVKGYLRH